MPRNELTGERLCVCVIKSVSIRPKKSVGVREHICILVDLRIYVCYISCVCIMNVYVYMTNSMFVRQRYEQ